MGNENQRMKKLLPYDVLDTKPRPRRRVHVSSRPTKGSFSTQVYLIGSSLSGTPYAGAKSRINKDGKKSGDNGLHGVKTDIYQMSVLFQEQMQYSIFEKHDAIRGTTRQQALETIIALFKGPQTTSIVYYSGHGQELTGSWCLVGGALHASDILAAWIQHSYSSRENKPSKRKRLVIIADCCFSANIEDSLFMYDDSPAVGFDSE